MSRNQPSVKDHNKNSTQQQKTLRQMLKQQRANTSKFQKSLAAQQSYQALVRHKHFKQSKHIALYWSVADECSTRILIKKLLRKNKRCYLPAINKQQLIFKIYKSHARLETAQFNIPQVSHAQSRAARHLDLVICPLLGFDQRGSRIGMGGGFYDRSFAFKKTAARPFLIGLAYKTQQVDYIPRNAWDVNLDGLIVGSSLRVFNCK